MTDEEAQKVAKIVGTADNRCPVCVHMLLVQLRVAFPQFIWDYDIGHDEATAVRR